MICTAFALENMIKIQNNPDLAEKKGLKTAGCNLVRPSAWFYT